MSSWFDGFPKAKVGDMTMLIDPADKNIGYHLQKEGVWEPRGTELVNREFSGGVFIDIGAHWGYYSLLVAHRAETVYAFEANPINFRYLQLNILINGLNNVKAYPLALWNEATTLQSAPPNENTGGTGVASWESGPRIQAVSLDSLNLGRVDFIKVDAEGSDSNILKGALETIVTYSPKLLVESPPVEFLHNLGYRMEKDVGDGMGPLTFWKKA